MRLSTTERDALETAIGIAAAETTLAAARTRTGTPQAVALHHIATALEAQVAAVRALSAVDIGDGSSLRFRRPSRALAGLLTAGALAITVEAPAALAAKRPTIMLPPNPGGESDEDADAPAPAAPDEDAPDPAPAAETPLAPTPPVAQPNPEPVAAPPPAAPPASEPPEAPSPPPADEQAPSPDPPAAAEAVPVSAPEVATPQPPTVEPAPPPTAVPPPVVADPTPAQPEPVPASLTVEDLEVSPEPRTATGRQKRHTDRPTSPAPVASAPSRPAPEQRHANVPEATHIVEPGDSLWSIAQRSLPPASTETRIALATADLWRTNAARIGTGDPDVLLVGTRLLIPDPVKEQL